MESFFDDNIFDGDIEEQIGDIERLTDEEFFDKIELDNYNDKIKKAIKKVLEQNNDKI